jgi:hypothetical protein
MLEIVVENTNKNFDTVSVNYSDCEKYKVGKKTLSEMKAFIGLLYNFKRVNLFFGTNVPIFSDCAENLTTHMHLVLIVTIFNSSLVLLKPLNSAWYLRVFFIVKPSPLFYL